MESLDTPLLQVLNEPEMSTVLAIEQRALRTPARFVGSKNKIQQLSDAFLDRVGANLYNGSVVFLHRMDSFANAIAICRKKANENLVNGNIVAGSDKTPRGPIDPASGLQRVVAQRLTPCSTCFASFRPSCATGATRCARWSSRAHWLAASRCTSATNSSWRSPRRRCGASSSL